MEEKNETSTGEKQETIQVIARIAPRKNLGGSSSPRGRIHLKDEFTIGSNDKSYVFDDVLSGKHGSQNQVYGSIKEKSILPIFHGHNGTVIAYGSKGSGKTWTMFGDNHDPGVVPLAIKEIFDRIKEEKSHERPNQYKVDVSFVEYYNNKFHDLHHTSSCLKVDKGRGFGLIEAGLCLGDTISNLTGHIREEENKVVLHECGETGVFLLAKPSLHIPVHNAEEAFQVLVAGLKSRTKVMGECISHCIFTVSLAVISPEQTWSIAKVDFVDLVPERIVMLSEPTNKGEQHQLTKEQQLIKKANSATLLTLTRVINTCAGNSSTKSTRKKSFTSTEKITLKSQEKIKPTAFGLPNGEEGSERVPYFESELTHYLMEAFGGHNNTTFIVTIDPNEPLKQAYFLNLACSVKTIINKPRKNALHHKNDLPEEWRLEFGEDRERETEGRHRSGLLGLITHGLNSAFTFKTVSEENRLMHVIEDLKIENNHLHSRLSELEEEITNRDRRDSEDSDKDKDKVKDNDKDKDKDKDEKILTCGNIACLEAGCRLSKLQLQQKEEEIAQLRVLMEPMDNIIEKLQQEAQQREAELQKLRKHDNAEAETVAELTTELNSLKDSYTVLKHDAEAKIYSLQAELEETGSSASPPRPRINRQNSDTDGMLGEIIALKRTIASMQNEDEGSLEEANESFMEDMKSVVDPLKDEVKMLSYDNQALQRENIDVKAKLALLLSEGLNLKTDYERSQSEVAKEAQEIEQLKATIAKMVEEGIGFRAELSREGQEMESLRAQKAEAEEEVAREAQEIEELKGINTKLQSDTLSLKSKEEAVQAKYVADSDNQALDIETLRAENAALKESASTLKSGYSESEIEKETGAKELELLRATIAVLEESTSTLQVSCDKSQRDATMKDQEMEALTSKLTLLQSEDLEFKTDYEKSQSEVAKEAQEIERLKATIAKLVEEGSSLRAELSREAQEMESLRAQKAEAEEEVVREALEIEELKGITTELQSATLNVKSKEEAVLAKYVKMLKNKNDEIVELDEQLQKSHVHHVCVCNVCSLCGKKDDRIRELELELLDLRQQLLRATQDKVASNIDATNVMDLKRKIMSLEKINDDTEKKLIGALKQREVEISALSSSVSGSRDSFDTSNSKSLTRRMSTVVIDGKKDPDQEALEMGILLSCQTAKFGTNMLEFIKEDHEAVISEYALAGLNRMESILVIFEERFGKVHSSKYKGFSNEEHEIPSLPNVKFTHIRKSNSNDR